MADSYSASLRFQLQQTGNNSGTWGVIADTQFQLIEAAITGDNSYAGGAGGISLAGLTTYTLTVAQGTADQARQQLYPFVGALTADCAVTIPGVVKIGWALNATTGGHSVILKVGIGGSLTLPPGGGWTFFYCDGVNVTAPGVGFGGVSTPGALSAATLTLTAGGNSISFTSQTGLAISQTSGGAIPPLYLNVTTSPTNLVVFGVNNSAIGTISTSGGTVSYNTTSDYRIKTVYGPADTGALIDSVPVYSAAFAGMPQRPMFLAHELAEALPAAVTGEKDAVDGDGEMILQLVDHPMLVPVLWAEMQALRRRITSLEALLP